MNRVLVLGGYGLLGSSLCPMLEENGCVVFRQSRKAGGQICINPENVNEIERTIVEHGIDTAINLIAMTSVDQCEQDLNLAYHVNVKITESISNAINNIIDKYSIFLVHISTDHLYGMATNHNESHVSPVNVYSLTKYTGEFLAKKVVGAVLRTSFVGKSFCKGKNSLTDWVVNSLQSEKKIEVYEDVIISALHTSTLCQSILKVIQERRTGTYNVGTKDSYSKAELAFGISRRLGLDERLMTIAKYKDVDNKTPRPLDMSMDSSCFERNYNFILPDSESQFDRIAEEYTSY